MKEQNQPLPLRREVLDTQWQCTICGRVGTVGRCCGNDTRKPLNYVAREEERRIKNPYRGGIVADIVGADITAQTVTVKLRGNEKPHVTIGDSCLLALVR